MAKLQWDKAGERLYETGVSNCVLYVVNSDNTYGEGVAWNGVTAVTETPGGAEPTALYADNTKYLSLLSAETFGAKLEAYMYPDAFAQCNGEAMLDGIAGLHAGQQARKTFGLVYKTKVGTDTNAEEGYKIHIIYGAQASAAERAYATVNESPEAIKFSWNLSTTPVKVEGVEGVKPTSILTIDSTKVDKSKTSNLTKLEEYLFGSNDANAKLLLPKDVISVLKNGTLAVG